MESALMGRVLDLVVTRAAREIRTQAGVVRALLDEVDSIDPAFDAELDGQLIEELARLGCRILEAASAMSDDASHPRLRDPDAR